MDLELNGMSYEGSPKSTHLERKRKDMITTYKFLRGHDNGNIYNSFLMLRVQNKRAELGVRQKRGNVWRDERRHLFSNRIVDSWNRLSQEDVNAITIGE